MFSQEVAEIWRGQYVAKVVKRPSFSIQAMTG
jgi:hypothetical protein